MKTIYRFDGRMKKQSSSEEQIIEVLKIAGGWPEGGRPLPQAWEFRTQHFPIGHLDLLINSLLSAERQFTALAA